MPHCFCVDAEKIIQKKVTGDKLLAVNPKGGNASQDKELISERGGTLQCQIILKVWILHTQSVLGITTSRVPAVEAGLMGKLNRFWCTYSWHWVFHHPIRF